MSAFGPKRTFQFRKLMSAFEGKADIDVKWFLLPLMTQSGHVARGLETGAAKNAKGMLALVEEQTDMR
jgi:hypothetical protein